MKFSIYAGKGFIKIIYNNNEVNVGIDFKNPISFAFRYAEKLLEKDKDILVPIAKVEIGENNEK